MGFLDVMMLNSIASFVNTFSKLGVDVILGLQNCQHSAVCEKKGVTPLPAWCRDSLQYDLRPNWRYEVRIRM